MNNGSINCDNIANVKPNDLAAEITNSQCENLGVSTGLSGNEKSNCDDLTDMVCLIKQDVDAIATKQAMVIAPNDASKCQADNNPTLASFWSRVLRFSEAVTCILCEYDPFVATILKSGRYPQILMGSMGSNGYPQWVNPDDIPTEGSSKPVTSSGVVEAVKEAILSVWHLWEEYPNFMFFAQTLNDPDNLQNLENQSKTTTPYEGDTALVAFDGTDHNVMYKYGGGKWVKEKVFGPDDKLTNFAVTHIIRGYYADKGVYYFHDGNQDTWQVMDVELGDLESRVEQLEQTFRGLVTAYDEGTQYVLATAGSLEEAENVQCLEDKSVIVLIAG